MVTLFRSGDGESADKIIVALEVPDDGWFKRNLIGALELMCRQENWTANGTATIDFATDKANEMVEEIELDVIIPVMPIGATMLWWNITPPDKWLIQDGTFYDTGDYPELFALLGYDYGGSGSSFGLPNMENVSPMGAGSFLALGDTFGAATRAILQANLPNVALPVTDPGHVHTLTDPGHAHTLTDPGHSHLQDVGGADAYLGTGGAGRSAYGAVTTSSLTRVVTDNATTGASVASNTTGASVASHATGVSVNSGGSNTPLSIVHPVRAAHFIIYAGR